MPKLPGGKTTFVTLRLPADVMKQLEAEKKRTTLSRAALLKLAWSEYMERRAAVAKPAR